MGTQFSRFISFWNMPFGPICTLSLLLAVLGTFAITVTFPVLGLVLIAAAPWLLAKVQEMELPGGFKIKMNDLINYTEEAKNAGLYKESDQLTDSVYVSLYEQDPNLALAGLRIEIEKRLRKLADIAGLDLVANIRIWSLKRLSAELSKHGYLSKQETTLLTDLLPTLNRAVHGEKVTLDASEWVSNDGARILAALDEKVTTAQSRQKNLKMSN